jgi:glycine reductase complex component B subunit gamma
VIGKEIEKEGIPVVQITTMTILGQQIGTNRIVEGRKVVHPCGDPDLTEEADREVRRNLVKTALRALQTAVDGPTIFTQES